MTERDDQSMRRRSRDLVIAACCGAFVAAMVGAAYAAVPLYNWFCRTTGFGGTTQVSHRAPDHVLDRKITVRFDANVEGGLPWKFRPEQNSIDVRIGQVVTIFYKVTNLSARETAGQAGYNVSPPQTGLYFQKINCFCFTEQRFAPGETRDLPVVFYIDPKIAKDSEQDSLNTITLSYTYYPAREPAQPVANSAIEASHSIN
ncbi:MAG TPA: cytochrome c oxidase assembly protein [Xanthobacteraceae bacterium]|nr:cytochrome c oxidase assembly protein [Xanthobacteraceae bacterium]